MLSPRQLRRYHEMQATERQIKLLEVLRSNASEVVRQANLQDMEKARLMRERMLKLRDSNTAKRLAKKEAEAKTKEEGKGNAT